MSREILVNEVLPRWNSFFKAGLAISFGEYPPDKRGEISIFRSADTTERLQYPATDELLLTMKQALTTCQPNNHSSGSWTSVNWGNGDFSVNATELSTLAICFTDFHDQPIPAYLIPPPSVVQDYINMVLRSRKQLGLDQQFHYALCATESPLSAGVLLFTITRHFARQMDSRLFPNIEISEGVRSEFIQKLGSFADLSRPGDAEFPGDNYYFWTNFSVSGLLAGLEPQQRREDALVSLLFKNGADLMFFSRKFCARQPNETSHEVPAQMGLDVGKQLALDSSHLPLLSR